MYTDILHIVKKKVGKCIFTVITQSVTFTLQDLKKIVTSLAFSRITEREIAVLVFNIY